MDMDIDEGPLTDEGELLITAILEKRPIEEVRPQIKSGAPLWYQNEEGISALHAAAYSEDLGTIRLLLGSGAVWNAGEALKVFIFYG